jgi:hypothetical protein
MRLIGYACRHPDPPLGEAFLTLGELTVLLGPNDSGKSSLLRAIDRDLSGGHFEDADEDGVKLIGGVFYAEVSDNELWTICGTAARTRSEQRGDTAGRSRGQRPPWDDGLWGPPKYESFNPGDPQQWIEHLREESEERSVVLDALASSRVVAIECAGTNRSRQRVWNTYWCLPALTDLAESLREALEASDLPLFAKKRTDHPAIRRGLYSAMHGNPTHLHVDGAPVPVIALGPYVDLPMPSGLAAPTEFATIRAAVREGITKLVDAACHTDDVTRDGEPVPAHERAEREAPRGWLAHDEQRGYLIRPETIAAARFLSSTADRLLPDFVSSTYLVQIELRDLDTWFSQEPFDIRLRRRNTGALVIDFTVERCADGYRLWLQLALLDALEYVGLVTRAIWDCASDLFEVERDRQSISNVDQAAIEAWEGEQSALKGGLQSLLEDFVNSDYSDGWPRGELGAILRRAHGDDWTRGGRRDRRFFLVDEPERHLHPRLQRAAAAWLAGTTSDRQAPCLLATHSAPFLGLSAGSATYVLVNRDGERTKLQPFDPADLTQLDRIAATMGFDRGDLLTLVNVWLVVEGETDKAVLDTLFARELHEAGIEVVPMHGTAKWQAVLEADALWRFTTAAVTVMFDRLAPKRVIEMREMNHSALATLAKSAKEPGEVKDMARLLQAAKTHNKTVEPIANSLPDMLSHLDEAILREVFPKYPGHDEVNEAWQKNKGKGSRDKFLRERYGVEKTQKAFERVARAMAEKGIKPSGLAEIVAHSGKYATRTVIGPKE